MKSREIITATVLVVLALAWAFLSLQQMPKTKRVVNAYTVVGSDMREKVQCDFEEPLKHLTLIMHWYDTNAEMYADYITLANRVEHEEIWGWSDCLWQPDDDFAACDIYVVKPDFVHADMNVDTMGHEVLHAACGNFHD